MTFVKNIYLNKNINTSRYKHLLSTVLKRLLGKTKKVVENITANPLCYSCENDFVQKYTCEKYNTVLQTDEKNSSKLPMTSLTS